MTATTETALAPTLPLEWTGHAWAVTDPAAVARIDRPALSASTMKSIQSCPSRFAVDKLLPQSSDPFSPAEIGTAGHSVLERLFTDRPAARTKDRLVEHLLSVADEVWTKASQEVDRTLWINEVMGKVMPIFTIEDPTQVEIISLEGKISDITLSNGVPFVGFLDRVDRRKTKAGGIRVLDYKTGKATSAADVRRYGHDDHGDQLRLYVDAYHQLHGERPTAASVYYTGAGKTRSIPVTRGLMDDTLLQAKRAWTDMKEFAETGEFPTKVSALCGWCPLINVCPAAHKAGKEARVPAPTPTQLGLPSVRRPAPAEGKPKGKPGHINALDDLAEHLLSMDEASAPPEHPHHPDDEEKTVIDGYTRNEQRPFDTPMGDDLDPNSYQAMAVTDVAQTAVRLLTDAGQKVTGPNARAMAETIARIVLDAQKEAFGKSDWGRGSNNRIRSSLPTALAALPVPFGGDAEDWEDWAAAVRRRVVSIAKVAVGLYVDEIAETPWDHLVSATTTTGRIAA